jgi:hypothetical protein
MLATASVCSHATAHEHDAAKPVAEKAPATQAPARRAPGSESAWTRQPIIVPAGRPERGAPTPLAGKGLEASELTVFSPDLKQAPIALPLDGGRWLVNAPQAGVGGYHWLVARSVAESEIRTATTALAFPSKGPSPADRMAEIRPGLEVQPLLLPEHGGYREGDTWEFLVRFDGQSVPHAKLNLETENGTRTRAIADEKGVARVQFPRDFDPATFDKEGGAARTRKAYVVSAEIDKDGIRHVSAFNQSYYPDVARDRNLAAGLGFLILGMAMASPLLRNKKEKRDA